LVKALDVDEASTQVRLAPCPIQKSEKKQLFSQFLGERKKNTMIPEERRKLIG